MSLGDEVLLIKTLRLRTHGKQENIRSRAAEDCCPFGLVCACTWRCVRVRVRQILFSFGFRYDMTSEEHLSLVWSNDCQSRRIYAALVRRYISLCKG